MLAELQWSIRHAIASGDGAELAPLLVGARFPEKRLMIHQRHYIASLVSALLGKFPAAQWLVGTEFVTEAAVKFIRSCAPRAPCIADYGAGFPAFLAAQLSTERLPYLQSFGELEWHVGQISVAVDAPPLSITSLAVPDPEALFAARLEIQPGVRYHDARWPVDELMTLYLADARPHEFHFNSMEVCLELRGARGEFSITRLDPTTFIFRRSLCDGRSLGEAAEAALDASPGFDVAAALTSLFVAGLVTSFGNSAENNQ